MMRAKRGRHEATEVAPPRVDPPAGATDLVVVVLDSLRYDTWLEAAPSVLGRLGPVQRRFSYASWTAPSHYNLLTGLVPHSSPERVFASEYYRNDYDRFRERLNVEAIDFTDLLPGLWLPSYLQSIGYETRARVSMPVLNPSTGINRGFDDYELMADHHDMPTMVRGLDFGRERPTFTLLNVGETHYPYAVPGEVPGDWPRISGVHGVLKHLGHEDAPFFTPDQLEALRQRQVRALESVDATMEELLAIVPADTWVIVTSDHGELFGEADYFGHGPINHEKVLEVPFVEARVG
jgi:hypothetical protein